MRRHHLEVCYAPAVTANYVERVTMESTLGSLLVGILGAGVGLYLLWKILDTAMYLHARRQWRARGERGERLFCLHDPDTGNRSYVSRLPEKE